MGYMAHVTGLDPKYGLKREFLKFGQKVQEGEIYEVDNGTGYQNRQYGIGTADGKLVNLHMTAQEIRESFGEKHIDADKVPSNVHPSYKHMPEGAPRPLQSENLLFEYQVKGAKWLRDSHNAILADGMGLGKTRQSLAAAVLPLLVVCPASVKTSWQREASAMFPEAEVQVCSSTTPSPLGADITIINYDILGPWEDSLSEVRFASVIVDESHYLKDYKSRRFKTMKKIIDSVGNKIPIRYFLTGTPMPNRPVELYPQLQLSGCLKALPEPYRTAKGFTARYCDAFQSQWGWDASGSSNEDELQGYLKKCMLVRTKEEVLKDLPDRMVSEQSFVIDSSRYRKAERDFIKWYMDETGKNLAGNEAEFMVRMGQLNKVSEYEKATSTAVKEFVKDFGGNEHGVVILYKFKETMEALQSLLGDDAYYYGGENTDKEKQEAIDGFQAGNKKFFVAQMDSAKVGITLTYADTVIFMSLPWNDADFQQAQDRIYRIGQKNACRTIWLSSFNADAAMMDRIVAKRELGVKVIPNMMKEFGL